jgi:hypothetical protein
MRPSLLLCLLLDAIGMLSFTVPLLGESFDVIWAPVSSLIYLRLFGVKRGWSGSILVFLEEILPGTDFIPTFTLTWLLRRYHRPESTA